MFNLSTGVLGHVKYMVPLAALVPIGFGISLAIGKLPREQPEPVLSKAPVLQSPVASPATVRVGNAETTIVWAAETGEPIERANPSPPLSEIKPENTVSTISASEYEVASRPGETPAPIMKERKPRKVFNEAPRRNEASRGSPREQPHVIARHEKLELMPSREQWRMATTLPEKSFPMIIIGVGY